MTLKVLTVDDSRTIRIIVKKAFKPFDVEVIEAENGVDGLALAEKEKPDLIVLDITMPVMTGIEMLGKLKEDKSLKGIPVIMLTAESGKENVMQIIQMGVSNYIVKPFKGEQLIERAKTIVKLEPKKDNAPEKYFNPDTGIYVLNLPSPVTRPVIAEVEAALTDKTGDIQKTGSSSLLINLGGTSEINVPLIKLILGVMRKCEKNGISVRVLGSRELSSEFKKYKETRRIQVFTDMAEARAAF